MKLRQLLNEVGLLTQQHIQSIMAEVKRLVDGDIEYHNMSQVSQDLLADYAMAMHGDDPRIYMSMKGRDVDPSEWVDIVTQEPDFMEEFEQWLHRQMTRGKKVWGI